jgi:hypothetical protein
MLYDMAFVMWAFSVLKDDDELSQHCRQWSDGVRGEDHAPMGDMACRTWLSPRQVNCAVLTNSMVPS